MKMPWWTWVLIAIVVLAALPVVASAPELARYLRIKRM
jgi:hypothetical protein